MKEVAWNHIDICGNCGGCENPGGSATAGETSRKGAIRELREETGIVADENELILLGIVEVGGFVYLSFCVGNVGQSIEAQINGAFEHLEKRLQSVALTLESVVKTDALFRDVWDIPVMEKIIRERFPNGKYSDTSGHHILNSSITA